MLKCSFRAELKGWQSFFNLFTSNFTEVLGAVNHKLKIKSQLFIRFLPQKLNLAWYCENQSPASTSVHQVTSQLMWYRGSRCHSENVNSPPEMKWSVIRPSVVWQADARPARAMLLNLASTAWLFVGLEFWWLVNTSYTPDSVRKEVAHTCTISRLRWY